MRSLSPFASDEWQDMYAPFQIKENAQKFLNDLISESAYNDDVILLYDYRIQEQTLWFADTPGYEEYRKSL